MVLPFLLLYIIPMYLRPIQVPKGALISTQRIIMIFFLHVIACGIVAQLKKSSPASFLLVFKSFLGVSGGPGCVLNRVVHMRVNPGLLTNDYTRPLQLLIWWHHR